MKSIAHQYIIFLCTFVFMAALFSKKPKLTPRSQYPMEILQAIHTMENDLRGETVSEPVTRDPLVAFQPEAAAQGAPFYADPSILNQETSSVSNTAEAPSTSPFLVDSPETGQIQSEAYLPPQEPVETESILEIAPDDAQNVPTHLESEENQLATGKLSEKLYRWRFVIGGILVGTVLLGIGMWWWLHHTPVVPQVMLEGNIAEPAPAPASTIVSTPQPTESHYLTTQPNLLSLDTETVTAESIRTEFLKIALSIKQDNLQGPIAFLVRDQNYNPLAFSRLAYLLKLGLPADLLASLDEEYSLYFVLDGNYVRTGLALSIKESESFRVALDQSETILPKSLEPFFLDMTTAPKSGLTFRSGLYREQPVRYANIDQVMQLSIDYAIRGNQWLIGTSQNALRALLDRSE